ncbi:hypothetical protein C8R43DRAFT_1137418 [Mycena crocata]|nr:hypothetical protein C8R43DRAFT_1137418 [Mycena crocata]
MPLVPSLVVGTVGVLFVVAAPTPLTTAFDIDPERNQVLVIAAHPPLPSATTSTVLQPSKHLRAISHRFSHPFQILRAASIPQNRFDIGIGVTNALLTLCCFKTAPLTRIWPPTRCATSNFDVSFNCGSLRRKRAPDLNNFSRRDSILRVQYLKNASPGH